MEKMIRGVPMMDAISDGSQLGRQVANIQGENWEDMLDQPLADLRVRYEIEPSPIVKTLASRQA